MIRTLVWKEYREHRRVWLVTATVSWIALLVLAPVLDPSGLPTQTGKAELLFAVAACLTWAYGMVCGAMLLSGEVEGGTMFWLDLLPCARRRLWQTKAAAGTGLVAANAFVVGAAVLFQQVIFTVGQACGVVAALFAAGMIGMAWAILFSVRGTTVLQVISQALGVQLLVLLGLFLIVMVLEFVVSPVGSITAEDAAVPGLLALLALAMLALLRSAWSFAELDRLRSPATQRANWSAGWLPSWCVLLWLTWRQSWVFCLVLSIAAFAAGWGLLFTGSWGWPVASLMVGIICSVTTFLEEHRGTAAFVGEQRLPPGRTWFVKLLVRFGIGALALVLLLCPLMIVAMLLLGGDREHFHRNNNLIALLFDDNLLGALATPLPFFCGWYVTGFGVGQVCGIVCRPVAKAAAIALVIAAAAVVFWVPSLLAGGLSFWPVLGAPLAALVAGRLIFPALAAGRLRTRRTSSVLAGAVAVGMLCSVAGLAYRAIEVPEPPHPMDVPRFFASLPSHQQNQARAHILHAIQLFSKHRRAVPSQPPKPRNLPIGERLTDEDYDFFTQVHLGIQEGWPHKRPGLDRWMEKMLSSPWFKELREAAQLPLGVLDDPRLYSDGGRFFPISEAGTVAGLVAAHGLWRQSHRDPAAFLQDLRTGLALSRHLRHHANQFSSLEGRIVERTFLRALDGWMKELHGRPELLRQALDELLRHEARNGGDTNDTLVADYLIAQRALEHPRAVVWQLSRLPPQTTQLRAQALTAIWELPWERERNRRLVQWLHNDREHAPAIVQQSHWRDIVHTWGPQYEMSRCQCAADWHIHLAATALCCYQAVNGELPRSLEALVPAYLPNVPTDPYDGHPVRYRVSQGEALEAAHGQRRDVAPGQGILWCVGGSCHDTGDSEIAQGIYLVPLQSRR
jgi:hypothetical protein